MAKTSDPIGTLGAETGNRTLDALRQNPVKAAYIEHGKDAQTSLGTEKGFSHMKGSRLKTD